GPYVPASHCHNCLTYRCSSTPSDSTPSETLPLGSARTPYQCCCAVCWEGVSVLFAEVDSCRPPHADPLPSVFVLPQVASGVGMVVEQKREVPPAPTSSSGYQSPMSPASLRSSGPAEGHWSGSQCSQEHL